MVLKDGDVLGSPVSGQQGRAFENSPGVEGLVWAGEKVTLAVELGLKDGSCQNWASRASGFP